MKEIFCFLGLLLNSSSMIAQSNIFQGQEPNVECIQKLEKKLTKKFKKTDCFDSADNLNYLFIFTLAFHQKPAVDLFLNQKTMQELSFLYRKKGGFPINQAAIFNQNKKVVGVTEELNIYCYYKSLLAGNAYNRENKLVQYYFDHIPDRIFRINATPLTLYFAEKAGKVDALVFEKDQLKVLNIEEFVKCCWDQYFPKEALDIHYGSKP